MSDFLDTLVARSADSPLPEGPAPEPAVVPLVPSRFEPLREARFHSPEDAWSDESLDLADAASATDVAPTNDARPLDFAGSDRGRSVPHDTAQQLPARERPSDNPTSVRFRDKWAFPVSVAPPTVGRLELPTAETGLEERVAALAQELRKLQGARHESERPVRVPFSSNAVHHVDRQTHAVPVAATTPERRTTSAPPVVLTPRENNPELLPGRRIPSEPIISPPAKRPEPQPAPFFVREAAPPAPPRIVPEELPSRVASAPPTVNVTIGRVEVKAVRDAPQAAPRADRPKSNVMNLEQYLERRAAGGRA